MYQKKCATRAKLLFTNYDLFLFFFLPFSLPSPLSITRFYIFVLHLAKFIYYSVILELPRNGSKS